MTKTYIVTADQASQRLDKALASLTGLPRAQVQKLIAGGRVTCDGQPARSSQVMVGGDKIKIDQVPAAQHQAPTAPELTILYEDENVLAVDKPAGLLTHPAADQPGQPSVVDFIRPHTSDPDPGRPGIVHRLDKNTSGVLLLAKTEAAKLALQQQFAAGSVKKTYLTLVTGRLKDAEAVIDLPIGRHRKAPVRRAVITGAKPAQTSYKVLAEYSGFSLLELAPKTGRTHQIRVHLAYLGHPVVGDGLYGAQDKLGLRRHFLHAAKIEFTNLAHQPVTVESPLPPELKSILKRLESQV